MAIIPPWNPQPEPSSIVPTTIDSPIHQHAPASTTDQNPSTTESYPTPDTNPYPLPKAEQPWDGYDAAMNVHDVICKLEHQFHAIGIADPQSVVPMWLGKRNHYDGKLLEDAEDVLAYFQRQKSDADAVRITPQAMAEDAQAAKEDSQSQKLARMLQRDAQRTARAEAMAEIESAGAAWRKAVADRRALMVQWDAYVGHLHDNYKALKAALKKA